MKNSIQLQLFQTTKQLNLSETYEIIPKGVSKNEKSIVWANENIAEPVEKPFSINGKSFISEISPAIFKDRKTKKQQSHFPDLRENRIEYAIISLASKQIVNIDDDKENNKVFTLKTTYYRIQKEIIEAINVVERKNLKPRDCPYNITSIKEALKILKMTTITVVNEDGKNEFIFNRIKNIFLQENNVHIELGNMITNYISSGDWRATDSYSILASRGNYELKLRVLLNLKFRFASKNSPPYSPSLSLIISKIDFNESKEKRITLQKVVKIIEGMHEVEVDRTIVDRKIVDAIIHIYPTDSFIETMIQNNKLTKRTKEAIS